MSDFSCREKFFQVYGNQAAIGHTVDEYILHF